MPNESKISKTLSDRTIKSVIVMVLSMLFIMQVVSIETYTSTIFEHQQALRQLVAAYDYEGQGSDLYKEVYTQIEDMAYHPNFPIIYLQAPLPQDDF
mmetsp:Transcript_40429/g.61670  ORF Transcript_40429/g.61670 Transcript_40429/m.61670 type:complete len:97 (+) Transcript_40429:1084-1374(+)